MDDDQRDGREDGEPTANIAAGEVEDLTQIMQSRAGGVNIFSGRAARVVQINGDVHGDLTL
ncbi:hypothetical protein [Spirillospora sp. CA-294931]|uniref:hypothetical protein n=1 Tax=Spirillospora sp. CA-294931 TaxID=3240042 RepID=UPI003D8C9222